MNILLALKTLTAAIRTVEVLMPESPGRDKFAAAITIVEAVTGTVEAIKPQLQEVATTVVDGLRETGEFKAPAQ